MVAALDYIEEDVPNESSGRISTSPGTSNTQGIIVDSHIKESILLTKDYTGYSRMYAMWSPYKAHCDFS